ncbi:ROK family protein [Clostridium baratii]|uniref:ROK family protein n=1 Tax=Clostridium baratii TaxID=1561 RepID=UPI0006BB0309|nr:ROK family protein [Clostridium baratii]
MRIFACIDIGGTSIKYGLINEEGLIIKNDLIDTEAYKGGPHIIEKVKNIVREFLNEYTLSGICISTAGMVCPIKGEIIYSGKAIPNYKGTKIKEILEEEFNIRCEVENDVNCAALGELWKGSGKEVKSMACLTIGTGIGGAIILDKNIVHGFSNSAGEIGYMIVNGEKIQDIASTTALVKKVAKRKGILPKDIDGRYILNGYENGDEICKEEVENLTDILAIGITNISYLFNPETVVLGGGIMEREDIFRPLLNKSLKKYMIDKLYLDTNIQFAKLKNTAGMIGALYNFLNKENFEIKS